MAINNLSVVNNANNAVRSNTESTASVLAGVFDGKKISVALNQKGPMSQVQDQAEEISRDLGHRTKTNKNKKKEKGKIALPRFSQEGDIKIHSQDMPDLDVGVKLLKLRQSILDSAFFNAKNILEHIKLEYKDPSHIFLIIKELQKTEKGEFLEALNEAEMQLLQDYEKEIKAGLNITKTAYEFDKDSTQLMRDSYKEDVLNYSNLSETYSNLINKFGAGRKFNQICEFLLKAVAMELDLPESSMPKERLSDVLDDLYGLKTLMTIHQHCDDFLKRVRRIFMKGKESGVSHMMKEILPLIEGKELGVEGPIENVFSLLDFEDQLKGKIFTLTYLVGLARDLPDKIFNDENEKENAIASLQTVLDELISQEEQEEE